MKEQLGMCPTCGSDMRSIFLPDAPGKGKYNNRGCFALKHHPWHDAPGEPDALPEIKALARWKAAVGGTISVSEGNAFMDGYYAGRASQPPGDLSEDKLLDEFRGVLHKLWGDWHDGVKYSAPIKESLGKLQSLGFALARRPALQPAKENNNREM